MSKEKTQTVIVYNIYKRWNDGETGMIEGEAEDCLSYLKDSKNRQDLLNIIAKEDSELGIPDDDIIYNVESFEDFLKEKVKGKNQPEKEAVENESELYQFQEKWNQDDKFLENEDLLTAYGIAYTKMTPKERHKYVDFVETLLRYEEAEEGDNDRIDNTQEFLSYIKDRGLIKVQELDNFNQKVSMTVNSVKSITGEIVFTSREGESYSECFKRYIQYIESNSGLFTVKTLSNITIGDIKDPIILKDFKLRNCKFSENNEIKIVFYDCDIDDLLIENCPLLMLSLTSCRIDLLRIERSSIEELYINESSINQAELTRCLTLSDSSNIESSKIDTILFKNNRNFKISTSISNKFLSINIEQEDEAN